MSLSPGTRLGPYEIVSPLGAGGMGQVYKARDTRLGRTVAIKVLPPALAADPEFKARFEREAKSISALNHPHICTLYDVGENAPAVSESRLPRESVPSDESRGIPNPVLHYLIMEHLDGETLAARLAKGPVPVDQTLKYASQIADALDKAHRQGIVHRDLKPANIFLVRTTGASTAPVCKLLDFGLAKMGVAAPPGSIETKLVTSPAPQGTPLTGQGMILGTFQYMAPEQIEGQDADARTDIWGFGCVLYEMLTGKRAFDGKSQASLIASILERQPAPMAELQPMTPPALSRLVRTCLAKDPDDRFQTAHDLGLQLQWIEEGGSAAGLPAPVIARRKRREWMLWIGIAAATAVVAAAAWFLKPPPVATEVVAHFSYALADGVSFTRTGRHVLAISPDGTKIAFIANEQIYLRRMNELEARPIRGTNLDPLDLAFSPDGESIAFFVPAKGALEGAALKRIGVVGGKAVTLIPAVGPPWGVSWQGGKIVFSVGSSIQRVDDRGGTPETLVRAKKDSGEVLAYPQFLNGGNVLLYTVLPHGSARTNDGEIVVQPWPVGDRRVLVSDGVDGRVVSSGPASPRRSEREGQSLIYCADGTVVAQAFSSSTQQVAGQPVPVVEGVMWSRSYSGATQFGLSETGTLVFATDSSGDMRNLVKVDRQGHEEPTGAPPHSYYQPRLSKDGTKIALDASDGDRDILVWDDAKKTPFGLTSGPDADLTPVWALDGQSVIFRSNPEGKVDLFRRAADGTGKIDRLTDTPEVKTPQGVLKDGRLLVRVGSSLNLLTLGAEAKSEPALPTVKEAQLKGEVSPDGRWIAYQSSEGSTRDEIHVRPFPNTDAGHWPISSGGGSDPLWTRSGSELIYLARRPARLMVVKVTPVPQGAAFVFGTPENLLDVTKYFFSNGGRSFDVSPDGQRFLMLKPLNADEKGRESLIVITHWFDELRARMGGRIQ